MCAYAALDTSISVKAGASASPWDPVHASGAPNGAHAVTGSNVAAGGIDDEFDLLSSRSKSPPTIGAASAGTSSIHLINVIKTYLLALLDVVSVPVTVTMIKISILTQYQIFLCHLLKLSVCRCDLWYL